MAASLRRQALRIFQAALKAADPAAAVLRHVQVDAKAHRNVFVIGAGKASAQMARAIERLLGARITAGEINVKDGHGAPLRRIQINECGHPVPDQRGVAGARRIAQIASQATADDLIVCLISGGASALLPLPAPPITLAEKQKTTRLLLHCGASIHEMNCVRKHISRIKGGQLARLAYPATLLTLILSDVIGDDLDVIGSGPTVPDPSTFADARAIVEKYRLWNKLPSAVRKRFTSATDETPKPGDKIFRKTRNVIVGSNALAVDAAAAEARRLGFHTLVLSTLVEGEAREVARVHAAIAKEILSFRPAGSKAGLRNLGRRNHGHHSRHWTGRPQSGICAGRRARNWRLTRHANPQRRYRRHRRPHRCHGRHCGWNHARARSSARPQPSRVPRQQRFVSFFRTPRRFDQDRPHRHQPGRYSLDPDSLDVPAAGHLAASVLSTGNWRTEAASTVGH